MLGRFLCAYDRQFSTTLDHWRYLFGKLFFFGFMFLEAVIINAWRLTEKRLHCLPLLASFYRLCQVVVHSNSTKRRERVCSYSYDWLRVNGLCYLCSQVRERFQIIRPSSVHGKGDFRCASLRVGCAEFIHGTLMLIVQCAMFYQLCYYIVCTKCRRTVLELGLG